MEEKAIISEVEQKLPRKSPKTFTLLQSILLLLLSFAVTTGASYALGNYYFLSDIDMKRVNDQLTFYQEKVKADPANLENRITLGYTYYLKGQSEKAIKELMYVLNQDNKNFDAHYNLGLVYLVDERYDEALSSFNKAVEIAPRDYKGHLQMGVTYRNLKMYDEALKSLNQANTLNPGNSDIIFEIGMMAEEQGDYQEAVGIYKDALEWDPLYEKAVEGLERLKEYDNETAGE